jgi:chromosome segregation ATPase
VATQLQTQLAAVSRAVQSADQAVTAAAQLGLIPRRQVSGARLAELDQEVTTLRSQVDQIAAQIENPQGAAAAELARSLQTILGNADLSLGKLTTRLDEIDAAVVEYNDQVAAIRNAVQPSITIGTLLFTLIFGWLAAGQVSLFMHLLAWFRRP